jgi:hypothetical protein
VIATKNEANFFIIFFFSSWTSEYAEPFLAQKAFCMQRSSPLAPSPPSGPSDSQTLFN